MLLRIEQTPKDEVLGYKWIEVLSVDMVYHQTASGIPRIDLMCHVANERTIKGQCHHNCLAWDDIYCAIVSEGYKLVYFDEKVFRKKRISSFVLNFLNRAHHPRVNKADRR